MPTIDFVDIGDVLNSPITRGVIASIDSTADTCVLASGESCLIWYH